MKTIIKHLEIKVILIAVLAFLLGWQTGHRDILLKWENYKPKVSIENRLPPKNIDLDFKLFWDSWELLTREYLDKEAVDPQKMFYGAISGMVAAIGDPYTFFLTPEVQKSSKEELNGAFEGVGIQLGFNKDKRLVVVAPLSGTPAEKAGIKAQDLIVKIDDKDTSGISLPEAVKLIRGGKGTKVNLTILREDGVEPKDYTLTRDTIIVKSVEVTYKTTPGGKDVAILKLSRFGERTKDEWREAVSDVVSRSPKGLVLDIRNNPGGFLEGAVFIASEFLDSGDVVLQENASGQRTSFKVNRKGELIKIPTVVLINKGSASASEIVAGALQDRKRAKLVGDKSFGKGTIQEAQDLEGGTGIHITVAKWLTPNEHWVNDTSGLEPDIEVLEENVGEEKDETRLPDGQAKDIQLEKALELLD
ncbi:MAG: S41 family peptidase [Patescibacteria group bacterium]